MERELSRAQTLHTFTREGLVTQVQILGLASELKASNEIAKQNIAVTKEFMYFRVSQAPSRYYGLVCAVCFQDHLQQLEVRLIYTYCTISCCRAVYF